MIPSTYDGPSNATMWPMWTSCCAPARLSPHAEQHRRSRTVRHFDAWGAGGLAHGAVARKAAKARELTEQAERKNMKAATPSRAAQRQPASIGSTGQAPSREEAKQRFRAMEREIEEQKARANIRKSTPWISPFSVVMIVAGVVISQFVSGFGTMLAIMGLLSLVGAWPTSSRASKQEQ